MMKYPLIPPAWTRKAVGALLLFAFFPAILVASVKILAWITSALLPVAAVALVVYGLYRLGKYLLDRGY